MTPSAPYGGRPGWPTRGTPARGRPPKDRSGSRAIRFAVAAFVVATLVSAVSAAHAATASRQAPTAGASVCPRDTVWSTLIRQHAERYPSLEVADLYKLLHQATKGSEHAVPDRAGPAEWLAGELDELGDGPAEPLIDVLGVGGPFARVHLRPFIAAGGDPERLLDAFVDTASDASGDLAELQCSLAVAASIAEEGALSWSATEWASFTTALADEGYPAVHHSAAFSDAYRPAYRVIAVRSRGRRPLKLAIAAAGDGSHAQIHVLPARSP